MIGLWRAAADREARGLPFAVLTLVGIRGHAPQELGAKALVGPEGLLAGTVGGGKIEARAILHAKELLSSEKAVETVTWNLQTDIGMTCGGEVTLLFEVRRPSAWTIAVFGAGHVAQSLVRLLSTLECRVVCLDPREEWTDRLPQSERVEVRRVAAPAEEVRSFPEGTFFVVITQGHGTDVPVLQAVFEHHPGAPYVGAIGSEGKASRLRSELRERGVSREAALRLRCPIGLPVGANRPEEIAVSIAAELLQVRDQFRSTASTVL